MKKMSVILALFCFCLSARAQPGCTLPNNLFPGDTLISCQDTAFRLALPNYLGSNFLWSNGGTDSSILVTQTGTYFVRVADAWCIRYDTVYVVLNSLIQSPIPDSVRLCLRGPAPPLQAAGNALLWYSNPVGGTGSAQAIVPRTDSLGFYYYYVSQTFMGCESPRAKLQVEVIDKPHFDLGGNVLIPCNLDGVMLQVIPENYTSYMWWDGTAGPTYEARKLGSYILRADNQCGSHTDTVITVGCKAQCVMIPNAFTPNGDGLNDVFRATVFCPIERFKLMIYDRYGELVFQGTNPRMAWDGKSNGKKLQSGVYTYYCQYNDFVLKKEKIQKGIITLIQ